MSSTKPIKIVFCSEGISVRVGGDPVGYYDSIEELMQKRCEWDDTFVESEKKPTQCFTFDPPVHSIEEMFSAIFSLRNKQ